MNNIERIQSLEDVVIDWLHNPDSGLIESAERTIESGLFSKSDVLFTIGHFRRVIRRGSMTEWYKRITVDSPHHQPARHEVLCLHAGNLPMVGLQDVLAVLISGCEYYGKLSGKDPFLIDSLLQFLKNNGVGNVQSWSTDLSDFAGLGARKWMFAGSEDSLEQLQARLVGDGIIAEGADSLLRTAHFSVAIVTEVNDSILSDLAEAMFRYQGKGCRSVAVVYCEKTLGQVEEQLAPIIDKWFQKNAVFRPGNKIADLRHAYNMAVGIPSVRIGGFVIQEGVVSIDHPEIIFWQRNKSLSDIVNEFGNGLQQIYIGGTVDTTHVQADIGTRITTSCLESNETGFHTETVADQAKVRDYDSKKTGRADLLDRLENAQEPALDWKPDGMDVLKWLLTH